MKKIIFFILAAILLSACFPTNNVIGAFRNILFIDFEDIRSYGVEVTNGDLPEGAIPLGPYSETVCFGRILKEKVEIEMQESEAFPNVVIAKNQKRTTVKVGNQKSDLTKLDKNIADAIKMVGGDGIAKLTVGETTTVDVYSGLTAPVYHIRGIIYKNK